MRGDGTLYTRSLDLLGAINITLKPSINIIINIIFLHVHQHDIKKEQFNSFFFFTKWCLHDVWALAHTSLHDFWTLKLVLNIIIRNTINSMAHGRVWNGGRRGRHLQGQEGRGVLPPMTTVAYRRLNHRRLLVIPVVLCVVVTVAWYELTDVWRLHTVAVATAAVTVVLLFGKGSTWGESITWSINRSYFSMLCRLFDYCTEKFSGVIT